MSLGLPIPVLRSFDEQKAKEFYVDFLEFSIVFEHRFDEAAPLYMGLSKGTCTIHLSEHHGDCSPGAAVRIQSDDLDAFQAVLHDKDYRYCRPVIESMPWGSRDMSVIDPFGNRLTFTEEDA